MSGLVKWCQTCGDRPAQPGSPYCSQNCSGKGLTRKPRVGEVLDCAGDNAGPFTVTRVGEQICYTTDAAGHESMFIWRFRAGASDEHLNKLFTIR